MPKKRKLSPLQDEVLYLLEIEWALASEKLRRRGVTRAISSLSRDTQYDPVTIIGTLQALERKKYLEVRWSPSGSNKMNRYKLLEPRRTK